MKRKGYFPLFVQSQWGTKIDTQNKTPFVFWLDSLHDFLSPCGQALSVSVSGTDWILDVVVEQLWLPFFIYNVSFIKCKFSFAQKYSINGFSCNQYWCHCIFFRMAINDDACHPRDNFRKHLFYILPCSVLRTNSWWVYKFHHHRNFPVCR